jgi:hypothetical protein
MNMSKNMNKNIVMNKNMNVCEAIKTLQLGNGLSVQIKNKRKVKQQKDKMVEVDYHSVYNTVLVEMSELSKFKRAYQALVQNPWKVFKVDPVKIEREVKKNNAKKVEEVKKFEVKKFEVKVEEVKVEKEEDVIARKMKQVWDKKQEMKKIVVQEVQQRDLSYKSKYCNAFILNDVCEAGCECTFAHSRDEIKPMKCRWDLGCKTLNCHYIHSNEDVDSYTIRMLEPVEVPAKKTKFCKFVKMNGSCANKLCTFAHSLKELHPVKCHRDVQCVNERCFYIHSNESKQEYLDRV